MSTLCVCHSGKAYEKCCKVFHDEKATQNALQLMRSRYAAYALQKPDYIIRTTHPSNSHFKQDYDQWKDEILFFCQNTQFQDLKIIEFIDGEQEASVIFLARLSQNGQDISFIRLLV
jgi:SEC-C motif-containing protein